MKTFSRELGDDVRNIADLQFGPVLHPKTHAIFVVKSGSSLRYELAHREVRFVHIIRNIVLDFALSLVS